MRWQSCCWDYWMRQSDGAERADYAAPHSRVFAPDARGREGRGLRLQNRQLSARSVGSVRKLSQDQVRRISGAHRVQMPIALERFSKERHAGAVSVADRNQIGESVRLGQAAASPRSALRAKFCTLSA
jgi:hypothetical protein